MRFSRLNHNICLLAYWRSLLFHFLMSGQSLYPIVFDWLIEVALIGSSPPSKFNNCIGVFLDKLDLKFSSFGISIVPIPSTNAFIYNPVPPTTIGNLFLFQISLIFSFAYLLYLETLNSSLGIIRS